ncbi:MAG TPA: ATP-binding protein [Gammaproteobacteria bacterium]|nr:ATP-binding protein [Gammaproteobacteria bacterium]
MDAERLEALVGRAERVLERLEGVFPAPAPAPDWQAAVAFRWRRRDGRGWLEPVAHPHRIGLDALVGIERQKAELERNVRQFVAGLPANHMLLSGARGTGKSSLVKALLHEHADAGLRLIEVDGAHLFDLPDIVAPLYDRPERFLVFSDDLSFEGDDPSYKALKSVLEGSVSAAPENVLIVATSNRRHLMPEYMSENREARHVEGELHPGEATEEKVSLSDRFGLWVSFQPFDQAQYLEVVAHWLQRLGVEAPAGSLHQEAIRWAQARGSRSGRVAYQFARDRAGREGLGE